MKFSENLWVTSYFKFYYNPVKMFVCSADGDKPPPSLFFSLVYQICMHTVVLYGGSELQTDTHLLREKLTAPNFFLPTSHVNPISRMHVSVLFDTINICFNGIWYVIVTTSIIFLFGLPIKLNIFELYFFLENHYTK